MEEIHKGCEEGYLCGCKEASLAWEIRGGSLRRWYVRGDLNDEKEPATGRQIRGEEHASPSEPQVQSA